MSGLGRGCHPRSCSLGRDEGEHHPPAPQSCWQRAGASRRSRSQPDTFPAASRAKLPNAGHFPGGLGSAKRYLKKSCAWPYLRKREGVCAGPGPGLRASPASTPAPAGVRTLLLRASRRLDTSRKCSASSG